MSKKYVYKKYETEERVTSWVWDAYEIEETRAYGPLEDDYPPVYIFKYKRDTVVHEHRYDPTEKSYFIDFDYGTELFLENNFNDVDLDSLKGYSYQKIEYTEVYLSPKDSSFEKIQIGRGKKITYGQSRGKFLGQYTSTRANEFADNGPSGNVWTENKRALTKSYGRGRFVEDVIEFDGVFPDNGRHGDGFWYVKYGLYNTAPIISGQDRHLGTVSSVDDLNLKFTITDEQNDPITANIKLDGKIIKSYESITDGQEYDFKVSLDDYVALSKGRHEMIIEAMDDKNLKSSRRYSFDKRANKLEFISVINETDVLVKKLIFVLSATIADGDIVEVKACNNYLDDNPVWENMTGQSLARQLYNFKNKNKSAQKGQLAIWVIIRKASEEDEMTTVRGFSGGYE